MEKFNIVFKRNSKWIESVGLGFLCIPFAFLMLALIFILIPLCVFALPIAGIFGFLSFEEKKDDKKGDKSDGGKYSKIPE